MVDVIFEPTFAKNFNKIKNKTIKEKIIKQTSRLKNNPFIGKPKRYSRKGTRELYVSSFRLSYRFEEGIVYILDLYHKDEQ